MSDFSKGDVGRTEDGAKRPLASHPAPLQEAIEAILLEHNDWTAENGGIAINLKECAQSLLTLITQSNIEARLEELKKLWNATQPDITPEGTKPYYPGELIQKRIKALQKMKGEPSA